VLTCAKCFGHRKGVSISANPFRKLADPAEFESATSAFGGEVDDAYAVEIV